jgi:hypothetical protein
LINDFIKTNHNAASENVCSEYKDESTGVIIPDFAVSRTAALVNTLRYRHLKRMPLLESFSVTKNTLHHMTPRPQWTMTQEANPSNLRECHVQRSQHIERQPATSGKVSHPKSIPTRKAQIWRRRDAF